jgi:hypothetical protein
LKYFKGDSHSSFSDDVLPSTVSTEGFFTQQHDDPNKFMEDHILVKIAPVPSCQQIARKDYLWNYYKVCFTFTKHCICTFFFVANVDEAWPRSF